jgi:hypothetical protein
MRGIRRRRASRAGGTPRKRLTYANVIATLALFLVLAGGSAYAKHIHYVITKTSQIKPGVLAALKGNAGAVGATGSTGAAGAPGPSGISNYQVVTEVSAMSSSNGNNTAEATAQCPGGEDAIGGGFKDPSNTTFALEVEVDGPTSDEIGTTPEAAPTEWTVITQSGQTGGYTITVFADCATVSP